MATAERPVQRPASNSDGRKRAQERHDSTLNPFVGVCACGGHHLVDGLPLVADDDLVHDFIACLHAEAVGM